MPGCCGTFGDKMVLREEKEERHHVVAKYIFESARGDGHQSKAVGFLKRASANMDSVQITFVDFEKGSL
jgi:hypothetical protein